jgi:hypothetical protein
VGWDLTTLGPFAGPLGSYKPQYCGHIFGLLYIFPGWYMRVIVEWLVERTTIAGETEVLGENLPQRHFVPPQIPHA